MRLLFYSLHGDGAVEIAVLCQAAGIQLDIAAAGSEFVRSKTRPQEQIDLRRFGTRTPTDDEVVETIRSGSYNGILVGTPGQVVQLRRRLEALGRNVPLVVRHCGNQLAELKRLGVQNFLSPSPRALEIMQPCHTLLKPKLLDWDALPQGAHAPQERRGVAIYVHALERSWPQAWSKLVELNRLLAPDVVAHYGMESPHGIVNDVETMRRCRATVHLKDSGICCFAALRSLAMGTPVVMDEETHERCFFDGLSGVIVKRDVREMADELKQLSADDAYWIAASRAAYDQVRRYATPTPQLCHALREFVQHARRTSSTRPIEALRHEQPAIQRAIAVQSASNLAQTAAKVVVSREAWMQRLFGVHALMSATASRAAKGVRRLLVREKTRRPRKVRCEIGACSVILPADFAEDGLANWEVEPIRRLQAWLAGRRNALVIDVGCSTGRYSSVVLFANSQARVVALDSDLQSLAATRQACVFAPAAGRRLICVHGFVTDEASAGYDYRQEARRTTMRIQRRSVSANRRRVRYTLLGSAADDGSIPHVSLDSLFWKRVDESSMLIKCDVEGAELNVLRGAARLLASIRPTLLISVHPRHLPRYQHTSDQIASSLQAAGYSIEHLPEDHEQHWLCTPCERSSSRKC